MTPIAQQFQILVVGVDNLYRNAVIEGLPAPDIAVAGVAADEVEAVRFIESQPVHAVVVEGSTPFGAAIEAIRGISGIYADIPVLLAGSWTEEDKVLEAILAGTTGFLSRKATPEELRRDVRLAVSGQSPIASEVGPVVLRVVRQSKPQVQLSVREQDVLQLVSDGLGNKQIAIRLSISEKTVKAHLSRIFQRLGVTDRTQAAVWAERNGMNRSASTN